MTRDWQVYEDGPFYSPQGSIRVTLYAIGKIMINRHGFEAMGRPEALVPMFDEKNGVIGLQPTARHMPNGFPVRLRSTSGNYTLSIRRFCLRHQIRVEYTVRFRTPEIENGILVLDLRKLVRATRAKSIARAKW